MATSRFPQIITTELILRSENEDYIASLCICYSSILEQYLETVEYLHPKELDYFLKLSFARRIKSFLAGRYTAKNAVSFLTNDKKLNQILIKNGIFNQPIVVYPNNSNIQVSITHCDDLGAAIAFPESLPMGIDIERIDDNIKDVLESQITDSEKRIIQLLPYPYETSLTLLWTIKESLSKILRTGLTTPLHIFEINKIEIQNENIYSDFIYFSQYRTTSFIFDRYVCSIVYPKSVEFNKVAIKKIFLKLEQLITYSKND
ncbi:4'-phosphopantetheinyl transferase [Lysinibacillus sp. NPDC092081]|uniref:4'-phosphopantetheinyl transferase family protein n=1 Tax=Lysinibacillus sp. NPDC092081 TaxID=3364131 RepID=UPI003817228F